jgi:hypothetical protein
MVRPVAAKVTVYVEGGGSGAHSSALQAELRQGFAEFFSKTVLGTQRRPKVVACGGREQAFERFTTALTQGENALLLVDSEEPVAQAAMSSYDMTVWLPWVHLKVQAGWDKSPQANECDAHLMVQCMDSWLLCDVTAVKAFFGKGFVDVPLKKPVEDLAKDELYQWLVKSTQGTPKGAYSKGVHSFKLLALIDHAKVLKQSPWARRLVKELEARKP